MKDIDIIYNSARCNDTRFEGNAKSLVISRVKITLKHPRVSTMMVLLIKRYRASHINPLNN